MSNFHTQLCEPEQASWFRGMGIWEALDVRSQRGKSRLVLREATMNPLQESQILFEPGSMGVKVVSRCSLLASYEMVHSTFSNSGLSRSRQSRNWVKARLKRSWATARPEIDAHCHFPTAVTFLRDSVRRIASSRSPCSSKMETGSQGLKGPDDALFLLNAAVDTLDLAREATSVKPAKDAFYSASLLITTIRVRSLSARLGRLLTDVRRIRRSRKRIASN